jgi:hypothetical protein
MNPIGDVKGFILDVMKNIAIVFGVGYMGGSLVALTHLDTATLNTILPVQLNQPPYVGKKGGFSLTGYAFPYTLYSQDTDDFFAKVINWLVMSCALVFYNIRYVFRYIASIQSTKLFYDLFLFYLAPYFLVQIAIYARSMSRVLMIVVALYSIFMGEYIFHQERLKNGLWYFLAPLSFTYETFVGPIEDGLMPLIIRLVLTGMAFMVGWFSVLFLYPMWWYGVAIAAILYYILFLFFSPLWYGFEKVITEMGNHRISLTVLFMLLTIQSSQSYLVTLATAGVVVGSIFMLYSLIKNKFKK